MSLMANLFHRTLASGFQVDPGQRFREVGTNVFGAPRAKVWEVVSVHLAGDEASGDGIPHARLRNVADARDTRHLAVSVLCDRAFYHPADAA